MLFDECELSIQSLAVFDRFLKLGLILGFVLRSTRGSCLDGFAQLYHATTHPHALRPSRAKLLFRQ